MTIESNDPIPDVTVTMSDGTERSLASFRGAPLVVYLYPRDDTAGCTREALEFSAAMPHFTAAGVQVLGISRDSPARHAKFAAKHGLAVPLATDSDGAALEAFGSWVEKSMYGRAYMGIDRSTFLFDAGGRLKQAWRKVRVPGHVEEVLAAARALDGRR